MLLNIHLHPERIELWPMIAPTIISEGIVQHKAIESLIGKLRFTQTSIFGRFGRTLLNPLYSKLHSHPYDDHLSIEGIPPQRWRAASIRASAPLVVEIKSSRPEILIYTDAATAARIVDAVIAEIESLLSSGF